MLHLLLLLWATASALLATLLVLVIAGQTVVGAARRLVRGMSDTHRQVAHTS